MTDKAFGVLADALAKDVEMTAVMASLLTVGKAEGLHGGVAPAATTASSFVVVASYQREYYRYDSYPAPGSRRHGVVRSRTVGIWVLYSLGEKI